MRPICARSSKQIGMAVSVCVTSRASSSICQMRSQSGSIWRPHERNNRPDSRWARRCWGKQLVDEQALDDGPVFLEAPMTAPAAPQVPVEPLRGAEAHEAV